MTTIEWGREIPVNGKRPAWLSDDEVVWPVDAASETPWSNPYAVRDVHVWSLITIRLPADHFAYKALDAGFEPWGGGDSAPEDWDGGEVLLRNGWTGLPSPASTWWSHFDSGSYIIGYRKSALDWSQPIEHIDGTPLVVRSGPDEFGEYTVGREDGDLFQPIDFLEDQDTEWNFNVRGEFIDGESCGQLIRNRTPHVKTIKCMTEEEAKILASTVVPKDDVSSVLKVLSHLGVIREETEAECFTRETGFEVTPAVAAALAWRR